MLLILMKDIHTKLLKQRLSRLYYVVCNALCSLNICKQLDKQRVGVRLHLASGGWMETDTTWINIWYKQTPHFAFKENII
jgi:hypothetical protein